MPIYNLPQFLGTENRYKGDLAVAQHKFLGLTLKVERDFGY